MTGTEVFLDVVRQFPQGTSFRNFLYNLNLIYRRVWNETEWTWRIATNTAGTIPATGDVTLPSTIASVLRVWYVDSEGNKTPVKVLDINTFQEKHLNDDVGITTYCCLSKRGTVYAPILMLYPRPESSSNIQYSYSTKFTALTALTGTILMPDPFIDVLVMWLCATYSRYGMKPDWDSFRTYHDQYKSVLQRLVRDDVAGRDFYVAPSRADGLESDVVVELPEIEELS